MKTGWTVRLVAAAVVWCGAMGAAWAQAAALAPGQVSGAEMQSWLDADGFAVGGIMVSNGCHFLARGAGAARTQSLQCANAAAFSVLGEGKVMGNQFCSKFDYPDGRRVNICLDLFKVGDNKYEFRDMGAVTTVLYRLTR